MKVALKFRNGLMLASAAGALCLSSAAAAQSEGGTGGGSGIDVRPYIEAAQVLTAELDPGNDVVTYTSLAAGVDAGITGRNSAASLSLRYERRIGWGDSTSEGDTISGIARASMAIIPRAVTFEAGGLAARTRVEGSGATSLGGFAGNDDATSQIYSVYAGPSVQTNVGAMQVEGHYRIGYTRVEAPDTLVLAPGAQAADILDDSVIHAAQARVGFAPGTVLPVVGVGVGGGWNEQHVSNLDQRVRDRHVRADVTIPVAPTLALVGGVGYEEVQISSRDALRDTNGDPVIGADGRFVTDTNAPRQIAYETDGLIWDAGVMWRPSSRTSLSATVGRRYSSTTYYGNLSYTPNARSSLTVSVYDSITGFGGALTDRLANLPAQFDAFRNPITGDLGGCVAGAEGSDCSAAGIGSVRSALFRGRGVNAAWSHQLGMTSLGLGAGYDRRRFIAAAGTVLAAANGAVDENYYVAAFASRQLDQRSSLTANGTVNWFESGLDPAGDGMGYSATLAYYRNFFGGLSGSAAVGLDGVTRDSLPDFQNASALVGLRYTF